MCNDQKGEPGKISKTFELSAGETQLEFAWHTSSQRENAKPAKIQGKEVKKWFWLKKNIFGEPRLKRWGQITWKKRHMVWEYQHLAGNKWPGEDGFGNSAPSISTLQRKMFLYAKQWFPHGTHHFSESMKLRTWQDLELVARMNIRNIQSVCN